MLVISLNYLHFIIHQKIVVKLKLKRITIIIFTIILLSNNLYSQIVTQTIKGKVFDNETQISLPGANIAILDSDPLIGTTTDDDGFFKLDNVAIGRVNLWVSFLGYESRYISNLLISSGKEVVLNIPLRESYTSLKEVIVKPDNEKDKSINKMATLSAKTFSVEETRRYAGGFDDPSRLAGSFAGVIPKPANTNEIAIRGNAAKGLQWRVEGVEIPTPNHLAELFSGGGFTMMLSTNMLANSDFFTGAFPAEYGNALSGVFDLNLRTGNPDKRETILQLGSYGVELATEGPFKKGEASSYLVNYRYSTMAFLEKIIPELNGMPSSSDLSLKMKFPCKKAGVFSLWSINGMGKVSFEQINDPTAWETNNDNIQYDIHYDLTVSGLNHRKIIGTKSYLFSSVLYSATRYKYQSKYYLDNLKFKPFNDQNEVNSGLSFYSYLNHKFNSRHTNRTGIILKRMAYNYQVEMNSNVAVSDTMDSFIDSKGATSSLQLYSQSAYYLKENLVVNAGMHLFYFNLNNNYSIEPRVGVKWSYKPNQSLSFAYGKHSRLEPLRIYLMEVPTPNGWSKPNEGLRITKAHHFVLGYNWNLSNFTHLKIEPYYQRLYDVPVIPDSSFSMINYKNDMFFSSELSNEGTGRNVGIDLTFEHFLKDGFYYLFTASLFDSKYKGGDGIERNTRYNQNYVLNLLMGKEWRIRTNNIFSLNGKFTILGGPRYTPVDEKESIRYKYVIYNNAMLYEEQLPTNYYLDISLNYRINKAKCSHAIIFQIKNLLMQKDIIGYTFNYKTNSTEPFEISNMYPYFSYRFEF